LLHDFCNEDLSAFYFDIRKDRLYCDRPGSIERRACRSVMAVIFNGLSAWLAPILSFTAEEAWSHRPAGIFGDEESVHLRTFPDVPENWKNEALAVRWQDIRKMRKSVLEAIEPLRASRELGSSLEAKPVIQTESDSVLSLGDDLADICITSQIEVKQGTAAVAIARAEGQKCARCWKILPEVGENPAHPDICPRCADAVDS
jgi:isoleucyl-tRNA synthetase